MAQKVIEYNGARFPLSYEILHAEGGRDMLFLHGWGSNKSIMKQAFGACFEGFRHIYIDLPGFGRSGNDSILNTRDYASILRLFLETLNFRYDFVVGHSFGGKVATLLAPSHLILLSSAGILLPKSLKVKTKIALTKFFKPLFGGLLSRLFRSQDAQGMPHHMYETFKNVVDEDFSSIFRESPSLSFIFWGKEDRATPLVCAQSIAALIPKSVLFPLEGDHFFFLTQAEAIQRIVNKGIALKHYRFKIVGKVQGVGYRKFTQRIAREIGLKGYVRNLEDGSVEALCLLDDSQYHSFIEALRQGPVRSKVENIEIDLLEESHPHEGFEILY